MAYKFQLGAAKLGGAIESTGEVKGTSIDASDGNITDVADIALDTISADGNSITVSMKPSQATAFQVSASNGVYLFADTDASSLHAPKGMALDPDGFVKADSNSNNYRIFASNGSEATLAATFSSATTALAGALTLGTDLAVAHGGTGASTAAAARTNLGLVIGTDVEPHSDKLTELATMAQNTADALADLSNTDVNSINVTTLGNTEVNKVVTADAAGDVIFIGASANVTFDKSANSFEFADNAKAMFGTGDDVSIHWDGSTMKIGTDTSGAPITIGHATSSVTIGDNLTVSGDLTVQGTTTTVNSTVVEIADKNILLASGSADDSAANGGGFTIVSGDGNKTFNYVAANESLQSNQHLDVANGKAYLINGASVLNATTLGSTVVASSLTSVGTIATGVWQGTAIDDTYIGTIDNANKVALSALDIDGATDIGEDLVDADLLIVDNGAGGTNRKVAMTRIKSYIGNTGRLLSNDTTAITAAGPTNITKEFTMVDTTSNAVAVTMPDITDAVLGKVFVIKDVGNNAGTSGRAITINDSASGHQIDGAASITHESDRAAVSLIACKNGSTFFYSVY